MMKSARRMRLTGWILAIGLALLAGLPGTALAQPTATSNCLSCHADFTTYTLKAGYPAPTIQWGVHYSGSNYDGSPATLPVNVTAGTSFELDYIFRDIADGPTNGGTEGNVRANLALPTSWTAAAPGAGNQQAIASGWKAVWNNFPWQLMSTTIFATPFPSSPVGYTVTFASTNFTTGAGAPGAAYDNALNATPGDLDLVAEEMGADVLISVPAGTTPGAYTIKFLGTGHVEAASKTEKASVIGTMTVNVVAAAGDTTKPTVTAFAATSPRATNVNIPVTSFTATDNTAVTGYMITQSSTAPLAGDAGWAGTAPATFTATAGDGTKTLYPWAKDAAGNVSNLYATPASVVVDGTAPTTTHNAPAAWQNANVTVTLTPGDGSGTGVAGTQYCVDTTDACTPGTAGTSVLVTQGAGTAGVQYVRFRSTDNIGNVETTKSATVMIDKSVPTDGTLTVTPGNAQNALTWTAATDTGSDLHATSAYNVRFLTGATPPTCATGTSLYTGTALTYTHTPITNGTQYSYRLCAYDAVNNISAGATGSGTPVAGNTAPNAPGALAQYRSDGTTVVAKGVFTNSASPVMKGTITDPESNTVQLEVEIQLIASPFTNTPNCTSGALVASGSTAQATCSALGDGRYKWQARGRDSVGANSGWTQY